MLLDIKQILSGKKRIKSFFIINEKNERMPTKINLEWFHPLIISNLTLKINYFQTILFFKLFLTLHFYKQTFSFREYSPSGKMNQKLKLHLLHRKLFL